MYQVYRYLRPGNLHVDIMRSQQSNSGKRVEFDPLLGIFSATSTLLLAFDNFHVALPDAYKNYQEWVTGLAQVVICVVHVLVKLYEFPELPSAVLALKSTIKFPIWPGNIRIYRDTAFIVTLSYVLLLDINLSYIRLFFFPVIAIGFICMLCREHWSLGENGEPAESSNGHDDTTTEGSEKALKAMAALPFGVLLLIAQLNDDLADRFAISQFLLFLSTTLGALTYMMMRLPAGISTGVAPASELLHKAFFLLLLVTVHTVAAEVLGEDVVLFCIPELLPVLLWFSLHLDRDSSIIRVKNMKRPHGDVILILSAVGVALLSYLAIFMDKSGISVCTTILVSCGVSGLLAHYVVFMLRQWPGQKTAADAAADAVGGGNVVGAAHVITLQATSLQSRKKGGRHKGAAASLEVTVPSEEAGSCEDGVQLLKFWADALLIAAAALLVPRYVVATRLGLQEPLVETLCQNFRRLC